MMMKTNNEQSAKQQIINRLFNVLQGQGMYVKEDGTLSPNDKLEQTSILVDTMKFLKDYDENVKVLNKYWLDKRRKEKFDFCKGDNEDENKER